MRGFLVSSATHAPPHPARVSHPPICSIRNRLTALKKDRGEYIKASDVNILYQAIVKQGSSSWIVLCIQSELMISHPCPASYDLMDLRLHALSRSGHTHVHTHSHPPQRSSGRSHCLQQPSGYYFGRRLQPLVALLPHDRKDEGMSGDVQSDCQHAGECLVLRVFHLVCLLSIAEAIAVSLLHRMSGPHLS